MDKMRPNFTQIPNFLIDELMSELTGAELKVLLYIMRRTYGFQKKSDNISLAQISKGIISRTGEILEKGTGLNTRTVMEAIESLQKKTEIIQVVKKIGCINKYSLKTTAENLHHCIKPTPLQKTYTTPLQKTYTTTSVENLHTQKKEKESLQNKEKAGGAPAVKKSDFNPLGAEILKRFADFVDTKNKNYYNNTTQRKACDFLIQEYGFDLVLKVIELLPKTNKRPRYEFPHITTPYQLKENWKKIEDGLISKKLQQVEKKPITIISN